MNFFDNITPIQKEALYNEFKGHLFEFHICSELALKYSLYDIFLTSLTSVQVEHLKEYEKFLLKNSPMILKKLPLLAKKLVNAIHLELKEKNLSVKGVYWTGKHGAKSLNADWKETDLAIDVFDSNDQSFRIYYSLKLSKANSFTNTKSAGVMSFFEKYFYQFSWAKTYQSDLNSFIESSFYLMKARMEDLTGIEETTQGFSKQFVMQYGELPGGLPDELRTVLYEHYSRVMDQIEIGLHRMYEENKEYFFDSLLSLMGFSSNGVIQYQLFHENHEFHSIKRLESPKDTSSVEFKIRKKGQHFLEILIESYILQVRIKPMNKFTTPAYKVNCSIKKRDDNE